MRLCRWYRTSSAYRSVTVVRFAPSSLLALFGGVAEALGADHSSFARDLAGLAGMLIGVGLFMTMRRRVLAPYIDGPTWPIVAARIGMAAGFAVGFVAAGPSSTSSSV